MKFAAIILAVAVAGAFAQEDSTIPPFTCTDNAFVCTFKELGHKIKHHAISLGSKLAPVGNAILKSLIDQGKSLLGNGAQAVVGTVLNHFGKDGSVGKRDMDFLDKVKAHLANGYGKLKQIKEGLHAAFKKAYTKLTGIMADNAMLKNLDEATDKKIDAIVAEFKKDGSKGFFGMAKAVSEKIRDIFKAGMDKLREKFGKKVEARAILDFFNGLKDKVADIFGPHISTLKQSITDLANKVKEHGTNLVGAAKDQFDALKAKLSGHVDNFKKQAATLKGHGADALNALKSALADVANQATGKVKDTINDIVNNGLDAAKVAAGHLSGN